MSAVESENRLGEIRKGNRQRFEGGRVFLLSEPGKETDLVASRLGAWGYNVTCISEPSQQPLKLRSALPDLVVVGTPVGIRARLDVCDEVAHLRKKRYFPILLIVDWKELEGERLRKSGSLAPCVDDIIVRPFSPTELCFRVRSMVEFRAKSSEVERLGSEIKADRSRDALTGFYSQEVILAYLKRELERANKYNTTFSCLVVGANYDLGDRTDHGEGALVLRGMAELIREQIRKTDLVGKLDDDKFLILASGADQLGATVLAKKIVDAVSKHSRQWRNLVNNLEFGVGIVTFPVGKVCEPLELVAFAQEAFEMAVRESRNAICALEYGS